MPDPKTIELLRGLVLSASDLRALTDWPEALIEDYLNIVDNLILLANTLDVETDKNLEPLIYSMPTNRNFESRISELEQRLLSEPFHIKDSHDNMRLKMVSDLYHIPTILPPVAHGCCHGTGIAWAQALAVQNTWYPISDADMADGELHNAEHDGNGKITIYSAGHYLVLWSMSGGNDKNDDDTEIAIRKSGVITTHGKVTFQTPKANYLFSKSGQAMLGLTANDYIEVAIRTIDNNTPTLSVDTLNLSVILIDVKNA